MRIILICFLLFLVSCTTTNYNNDDLQSANNIQIIYTEFINNKDSINYPDSYWLNKNFKQSEIQKAKETYELYK